MKRSQPRWWNHHAVAYVAGVVFSLIVLGLFAWVVYGCSTALWRMG